MPTPDKQEKQQQQQPQQKQRRSVRLSGSFSTLDPEISRQRQSKRDEAIRKKLEQDLKKRGPNVRVKQTKRIVPGTVSALQPSRVLTVSESLSVMEACQLMATRRSDCIIVMNKDDHISGILTAKDIAYRAVGNMNSRTGMIVSDIMTPNPVCVTIDAPAEHLAHLMVARGFRHVPVCSEEGDIVGLLDITKCVYEALKKMERVYGSSQRLFEALEGIEKEWSPPLSTPMPTMKSSVSTTAMSTYMEALKSKMTCPDLSAIMTRDNFLQVSVKTHVQDVVKLMREHGTTAVLVMDRGVIAGIFTTKDLVLRVIAAGIRPENCSVVRVMTPEPEVATLDTTLLQALKKMHDGHYLHLPIVDNQRTVLGLVDVLSLTHATMELINNVKGSTAGSDGSKFWSKVTGDSEGTNGGNDDQFTVTETESLTSITSYPTTCSNKENESTVSSATYSVTTMMNQEVGDNNEDQFIFKFKLGNKAYRFRSSQNEYDTLYKMIEAKLGTSSRSTDNNGKQHKKFSIHYIDEDNDMVVMTCNTDVTDVVTLTRISGRDCARLIVVMEESDDYDDDGKMTAISNSPLSDDRGKSENSKLTRQPTTGCDDNNNNNHTSVGILLPVTITILGVLLLGAFSLAKPSYYRV